MKIERTKNAVRNTAFGILLRLYQIIVPFLMRTAMIYLMGVQYLGLSSLFQSVLQVLNLAELGVGSAMVYSMYKPIVEDDTGMICDLMKLYKIYYRVIGLVIAAMGIILTPFVPRLISGDVPTGINIYTLYLLNLGVTVLSYWLFAYKSSVLQAHQRNDIISEVTIITVTLQYAAQFIVLWLFHDYYLYVIAMLLSQALNNIITAIVASKVYPKYKADGDLNKKEVTAINQKIKDLFTSRVGGVIVNSADTIVISSFLGLTALAVYQNYYFILTAIIGIVEVGLIACTAGIGNSLIVESKDKNFKDLKKLTFIINWVAGFCSCCFLALYQPFMEVWVGKELMLDYLCVICFVVYFYVYEINRLLNTYKDAGGIWHEDRFRPLVTAFANLGMNLVMVQFWGIYGVLLSTVLSMLLVGMPWLFHNLFSLIFNKNDLLPYLRTLLYYICISAIASAVTVFICSFVNFKPIITLVIRLVICIIIPNIIFLVFFIHRVEFKQCIVMADNLLNGNLRLRKLLHIEGEIK